MSNHIQVSLKQRLFAQELRTVFYFSGGGVDSNQQNIVDYLRQAYNANIKSALADDWTLYAADVRDVGDIGLPTIEYTFTSGTLAGDSTLVPLPTQMAALVTFKASVAKPNLTRKFVPGFTVSQVTTTNQVGTTVIGLLQDWADDILDITTTYTGVALSSVLWNSTKTQVVGSNLMTHRIVNPIWSTQRRRRLGVGI